MSMDFGKPKRLKRDGTALVVVDFQERMMPAMREGASAVAEAAKLVKGFEALGCPVLVTQQYTKGLGESVREIREACSSFVYTEKDTFSAMGEQNFIDAVKQVGRNTIVICGIETHVCVLQTALDLHEAGYTVFIAVDAISSRKEYDKKIAVKRMVQAGITPTTVESILFELLENDAKSDTFKAISKIIK